MIMKKGAENIIHSNKYKVNQLYLSLHPNLLSFIFLFPLFLSPKFHSTDSCFACATYRQWNSNPGKY